LFPVNYPFENCFAKNNKNAKKISIFIANFSNKDSDL
jgi:hypothetical protein